MQLSKYTCIKKCLFYKIWIYTCIWGGVNDNNAVFKIQKKCLRLIKGVKNRVSFISLFGDFKILTVSSLYIFEILWFIKKNKIYTTQYSDIRKYNTKGSRICMFNCATLLIFKKKCN
jgi:hypothetical protein